MALTFQHTHKHSSKLYTKKCQVTWNKGYSHLYVACRSVGDCDQVLWSAKGVLDRSLLRLLIAWFSRVKGHIAAARSWLLTFSSLEVTLISWSAPQKGFDHLIQFWSRSQTLLHGTYNKSVARPLQSATCHIKGTYPLVDSGCHHGKNQLALSWSADFSIY